MCFMGKDKLDLSRNWMFVILAACRGGSRFPATDVSFVFKRGMIGHGSCRQGENSCVLGFGGEVG